MSIMHTIQPDSSLANMITVSDPRHNNNKAQVVIEQRYTKDGRTLWYKLEVLQQPERARACGSGPKSSADRRPVDPPPVVILRVLEGEVYETARDITFDYNVDFFCYASLEHARPMANGRVQTPAATSPPVLTGFPVSGCCYLDRPDPAGYFLFPDLSVRHEGRYRLVFSLYELVKNAGDLDRDAPEPEAGGSFPSDACHRLDLKSADFTVYSAKKFPGLTESTALSRAVAEQGCRVRIRRDVRMRRRDTNTKPSGVDEYNNTTEGEFVTKRHTQTPDGFRARSVSNSSIDRASFADRRPSNVEYGTAPHPPVFQGKSPAAMLNFGQPPNAFAQPSYGPMGASHPQSTPVSPAQSVFTPAQGVNVPPPPSPSYSNSYTPYDQVEAEHRRLSNSYPLALGRPLRSADHRSSISSNVSMENNNQRPILPSISYPNPPDPSSPYSERIDYNACQMRGGLYPQVESRQTKRSADESFPSLQQQMRDVRGDRLPMQQPYSSSSSSYMRADGKKVYPPQHLWLS